VNCAMMLVTMLQSETMGQNYLETGTGILSHCLTHSTKRRHIESNRRQFDDTWQESW